MAFHIKWSERAEAEYAKIESAARKSSESRKKSGRRKSSKQEGLFKQVTKALIYLRENPRHPSLQTHEYASLAHPYDSSGKVFAAYAQNQTPGAYRIFWCYGPSKDIVTVLAITPHP